MTPSIIRNAVEMIASGRLARHSITAFLVILSLPPLAMATPKITPLKTNATFSARFPESRWSAPIQASDGRVAYVLSLEPDFDVDHHVVTLELVLRRAGAQRDAPNLLDPTRKRHGLQAYDFAANDLVNGAQKSAYGENRTVLLKSLGLMVQIDVAKAVVSRASAGTYQVDALELQIRVDNATP